MKLAQNQTNTRVFYLTSSLESPYYLFRLVSKVTAQEVTFICTDKNSIACPFITVDITEVGYTGTENLTNAEVKLNTGSYKLYIYDQSSNINLDYTLTNELLKEINCYVMTDNNFNRVFL